MHSLSDFWDKFNKHISALASIITIVMAFADLSELSRLILGIIIGTYVFILGIYVARRIFNTAKAKELLENDYYNKNKMLAKVMHSFHHNLRNYISTLDEKAIMSERDLEERCKGLCDYIAEIYKTLFKAYLDDNNISVCFKVVKPEFIGDENYNNWKMQTLARSASTDQYRSGIDKQLVRIADNSDFKVILSKKYQDELFSFANMENIENDFLQTYKTVYKNSRPDFLKYYMSTIVVPIKIDGKHASTRLNNYITNLKNKDLILGFLCIDSMKTFDTVAEKNIFKIGVEFAKSMGDSLYLLFEKILMCQIDNNLLNNEHIGNSKTVAKKDGELEKDYKLRKTVARKIIGREKRK